MKLVTFSHQGRNRIGLWLESEQAVLDLKMAVPELPDEMAAFLTQGESALLAARVALAACPASALIPAGQVTLQAPVLRPGKLLCMGHNYIDHSASAPGELPEFPNLFLKASSSVIGPGQAVIVPPTSSMVDYEAEFCAVIGRRASRVDENEAMDYVVGYTLLNDISARDYARRTTQWMVGKSFDTFAPLGPWLVTKDEIPDPHNLELVLTVNGEERQHSNTRHQIFSIAFLISYLSQVMTLEPGDVLSTGTPSGSGAGRKPPVFLKPGDVIRITVERVGELVTPVADR